MNPIINARDPPKDIIDLAAAADDVLATFHSSDENRDGVEHHLSTEGPPVFAQAQNLTTDQLSIAKEESGHNSVI